MIVFFSIIYTIACLDLPTDWTSHNSIKTGQATLYNLAIYATPSSPSITFNIPHSLTPSAKAGVGLTRLDIPPQTNIWFTLSKAVTASNLNLRLVLLNQTIIYKFWVDYILMDNIGNPFVYEMLDQSFLCSFLNNDSFVGFRSQTKLTIPTFTLSAIERKYIKSVTVLSSYKITNYYGWYFYLNASSTIKTDNSINTTIITADNNIVYEVAYTVLFYNIAQAQKSMYNIFDLGIIMINANTFLTAPFLRYIAANRMFFGVNGFNFTKMSDTFIFLDTKLASITATPSPYNIPFTISSKVNSISFAYYFITVRKCTTVTDFFYKDPVDSSLDCCVASCSAKGTSLAVDLFDNSLQMKCDRCDYSCATCTGSLSNQCSSCNLNANRAINLGVCSCINGYVSIANDAICYKCSDFIQGCSSCSSQTVCTGCLSANGFTLSGSSCICTVAGNVIINNDCSSVIGCVSTTRMNNNGTVVCSACNMSANFELLPNTYICSCISGTVLAGTVCQIVCGNGFVSPIEQCDDGNILNGDGCSSLCKVEPLHICVGSLATTSVCKLNNTKLNLTLLSVLRDTSTNRAIYYVSVTPKNMEIAIAASLITVTSTMPSSSIKFEYLSDSGTIVITVDYLQTMERVQHIFTIHFQNSPNFLFPVDLKISKDIGGANCQLTYDKKLWINNSIDIVMIIILSILLVVLIATFFVQRWIGLELVQTFQSVFFCLSLCQQFPFQLSAIYEKLKFANGFNQIIKYNILRVYSLRGNLIGLQMDRQFLINFNVMYAVIVILAAATIITLFLKNKAKRLLQQKVNSLTSDKYTKIQKTFNIIFGDMFLMSIFFSMFQIFFSFSVQISNQFLEYYLIPDYLNVISSMIMFILFFAAIFYVLYWYLQVLPTQATEEYFLSCRFQHMRHYYPIVYLSYQTIFIGWISIFYYLTYAVQILLALQCIYFVLLVIARPYRPVRKFTFYLHNLHIFFNQLTLIYVAVLIIRWNSSIYNQQEHESELIVWSLILLVFLCLSMIIAILRMIYFKKDCLCIQKIKQKQVIETSDAKMKNMMNADTSKLMLKENDGSILGNIESKEINKYQNQIQFDETTFSKFMNEKHINWVKKNNVQQNEKEKQKEKQKRYIKNSSLSKSAILKKSPVESYIQMLEDRKLKRAHYQAQKNQS